MSTPSRLRRQPRGACRPLTSFGSGAIAASIFSENLADASVAALQRLVNDTYLPPVIYADIFCFLNQHYI